MIHGRRNLLLAAVALASLYAAPALTAGRGRAAEPPVAAADLATPKYGTWGFDTSGAAAVKCEV